MTEFKQEWLCVPYEPDPLAELAAEYHRRCDAFDETVVVGGVPRNGRQQYIMNKNAHRVRNELFSRLTREQQRDLQRAIRNYR